MNKLLDNSLEQIIRRKAILFCYGKEAIEKDTCLELPSGEIIYSWMIEDFLTLDSLLSTFNEDDIEYIYYNYI